MKKTFEDYPEIKNTYDEMNDFAIKNKFCKYDNDGLMIIKGMRYDDAIILNSDIDFNDKVVCELGLESKCVSGTFYYSKQDLFDRLITPS